MEVAPYQESCNLASVGYPESSQRSSLDDFHEFSGNSLERSARRGVYGHHPFPSLYLPPAQEYGDVYPSLSESRDSAHDLSARLIHRRPSVFDFESETYRSQLGDDESRPGIGGENLYLEPVSEPVTQPVTSRNSLFPECLPSEGPIDVETRSHLAITTLPHPDIFALGPPGAPVRRNNTSPPLHTVDSEARVTYLPHPSLPSPEHDVLSIPSKGSRLSRERSMSTPVSQRPKKKSKMHECEICHKLFPRPSGLQTHMNTHTDSKPFPCTVQGCNKRFAVRSNAKRHLRTHGIIPSPCTNDPEPTPYVVDFNDPVILPPSYSPQSQSLKGKLQWVPPSLATRTNVKSLRTCSEVDSESDDGGECFDRHNGVGSFPPALPMPLRTVVPTMPVGPHDEFFEERDSYLPAGSHPYHPTQFRGLPGPAPPMLQTAVY
ncbi:hypothetical protein EYR40_010702 [Pleurotus pulmonarius]|nr:hypothetical protein EYR36_002473 [Pleurotus pulmonarius]KAF4586687.1 hypothetical protein EYR40_010702 [Pleurotus pulmonarius]